MVLQNYQNLIEMTSNIIDIIAFGVGFKCPRKIHLNTQCPLPAILSYKTSRYVCDKDIDSRASMVLQNYQKFKVLTSNMIYIVAPGVGLKC